MAVKVRCPTCEKVLNAPDTARGKAVKCPGCETKVKVPAAEGDGDDAPAAPTRAAKSPAKAKAESDSSDFLAKLDLDKVADSAHSMCPRCGAPMSDDDTECPKCGVDPTTGQLSAGARKRKSMKGPDPSLFYKLAWSDSWAFVKENFSVVLRTFGYFLALDLLRGGCGFMVNWCEDPPPKIFWAAISLVLALMTPGWQWCVIIDTVRITVGRKSNIQKIHFDPYLNVALGIKAIVWSIVFWIWFPPAIVMFPLAMIHMAMPVTKRGWINVMMAPTFFKNAGPALFYSMFYLLSKIPTFLAAGLIYGVYLPVIQEFVKTQKIPEGAAATQFWITFGVALFLALLLHFLDAFFLLFYARIIGLMAYYFQNTLDLVVIVAEKEYKRKEIKVDRWGNPIKTTQRKVMEVALIFIVLGVVAGVGYWVYVTQFKK